MPDDKFVNFRELHAMFGDTLTDDEFNVMTPADRVLSTVNTPYYGSIVAAAVAKERTLDLLQKLAKDMPSRETSFALSDETRKQLAEYVAQSNRLLQNQFGIDTERYQYDVF